jgi:acyl carrier protein
VYKFSDGEALQGFEGFLGGSIMEPIQYSDEAVKWAERNFAEPFRPVASAVGQVLSTSDIGSGPAKLSEVRPGTRFLDDLGFDGLGLDLIEFLMDLEDMLDLKITDELAGEIINIRDLVIAVYKLTDSADSH